MGEMGWSMEIGGIDRYREIARRLKGVAGDAPRVGVGLASTDRGATHLGGPGLRKQLQVKIFEAGKPVVNEVRAAVRSIEVTSSHGGGGRARRDFNVGRASTEKAIKAALRRRTGLRSSLAAATGLQVTDRGVRILLNASRLPVDQRSLPRAMNSAHGWHHPVFGNRATLVHQQGRPYFQTVIRKRAPQFRRAIDEAVNEAIRYLES